MCKVSGEEANGNRGVEENGELRMCFPFLMLFVFSNKSNIMIIVFSFVTFLRMLVFVFILC